MDAERWQQIETIYHSALRRPPGEREQYLAEACSGDEALRDEVQTLILQNEKSGSFIDSPVFDLGVKALAEQAELSAGRTVGHYVIMEIIGRGGMGEVYLARDPRLGRKVALKLLPEALKGNADRVQRFRQEARAASAVSHPNIAHVYDVGEAEGRFYTAIEYVEGVTLRQLITERRLDVREAVDIAVQVAEALAAAHAGGIVHRDVKPENVMVHRDGYVKVLDFGLAKLIEQLRTEDFGGAEEPTAPLVHSEPGVVMGSVNYMSPEQARGEQVDARTDVWSLGVLLYEMLAGRAPFEGGTPSHVVVSIMEHEPRPLPLDAKAPAGLGRLVEKALSKEKEGRYRTAGEMAFELKSMREELPAEARLGRLRRSDAGGGEVAAEGGGRADFNAARASATSTLAAAVAYLTSSTQYVIDGIRRHRRGAVFASTAAFVLIASLVYLFNFTNRGGEEIDSVAVLPLVNEGGDPETEYLSDGISESLINSLAQLPRLKVIARGSSFKYKGKEVDPPEAAHALGVAAILTGRVTRRGDDLSISVELVDARNNTHVWGKQYDRKGSDLPQVQADLSREIAEALRTRLIAGEQRQLAKSETVNPVAYELVLKARFYREKGGTENHKMAVEYCRQAIEVDPNYALAYAYLSTLYSGLVNTMVLDPKEFTPKVEMLARKAVELDENLPEAHQALGLVHLFAWDWAAAERELKHAIELNPNFYGVYISYGTYLLIQGRDEEFLASLRRSKEINPLSPSASTPVWELLLARQYEQAVKAAKGALEADRSNPYMHTFVGYVLNRTGRHPEAVIAFSEAIKLGGDSPDTQVVLAQAYAKSGEPEKARAILKRLEAGKEYVSPVGLAYIYTALGEREQAFALLERAYSAHDQELVWLGLEARFNPDLRSDPRYQDLLRRIGIAQSRN